MGDAASELVAGYFEGLEVLEPGVLSVSRWRVEHGPFGKPDEPDAVGVLRAVGRHA